MIRKFSFHWTVCWSCAAGLLVIGSWTRGAAATEEDEEDYIWINFVGNADGSGMKPLVDLPEFRTQGSPDWSADGKWMAFDAWKRGQNAGDSRLFVVDAEGQNLRELGFGNLPSLSPQGHRLTYSLNGRNGDGGVCVIDVDNPENRIQVDPAGWGSEWSPEGTRIAYGRNGNLAFFNFVEGTVELAFDEQKPLPFRQIFWNFSWSHDGQKIALRGIDQKNALVLAVVDARANAEAPQILMRGKLESGVAWHPNGREIYFGMDAPEHAGITQLYRVELDKPHQPERIAWQARDRRVFTPRFSLDGKRFSITMSPPRKADVK